MNGIIELCLIFSLAFAFFSEVNGAHIIGEDVGFAVLLVWEIIALLAFIVSVIRKKKVRNILGLKELLSLNNSVRIVIYVYTLFLIFNELTESRFLSSNIKTFINGFSAFALYYLFGKKIFNYSMFSLGIAYVASIIERIVNPNIENTFVWVFELHDIAFGAGYIILFFLCTKTTWKIKNLKFEILCFLIIVLAFKRIGIFALAISLIYWKVINNFKDINKHKLNKITEYIFLVGCVSFVFLTITGLFWILITVLGINSSGRYYYYSVLAKKCDFSISFLGLGRNAVMTIFTEDYSFFNIGNVHSDILRMYAECGFVLFIVWLLNYLVWLPNKMGKCYGIKIETFVWTCTIYTFLVYLTDNTELYMINNFYYMLVILHYCNTQNLYFDKKIHTKRRWRIKWKI